MSRYQNTLDLPSLFSQEGKIPFGERVYGFMRGTYKGYRLMRVECEYRGRVWLALPVSLFLLAPHRVAEAVEECLGPTLSAELREGCTYPSRAALRKAIDATYEVPGR